MPNEASEGVNCFFVSASSRGLRTMDCVQIADCSRIGRSSVSPDRESFLGSGACASGPGSP
eukprot:4892009-Alexandrium_andersonii.AAC.1